ncbi:MAG TPA: reverse transcriptase domain-containing protein [Steroidobacteraceae bacterium]|nr:reverse transcriptase domain-containing protein [Steroidobacteraceae bacterium]
MLGNAIPGVSARSLGLGRPGFGKACSTFVAVLRIGRSCAWSYCPSPVKQVELPKKSGEVRILGVPTVADRIAQQLVKARIDGELEGLFHPDSYGYRPKKSAVEAIAVTRERCWKYDWRVEFDIRRAFDDLD